MKSQATTVSASLRTKSPSVARKLFSGCDSRVPEPTLGSRVPCGLLLPFRFFPNAPIVHKPDLAFIYFLAVFGMFHWLSLQVQVLGINRLLVENLVKLGAQVLQPVVPLRPRPVVAEGLDVDYSGHIG